MKFFSQFLSCYHPTVVVDPPPPDEPATRPTTTTTQQVPFSKRKKLTGSKSPSAVNWRPALSAISEDVVVVVPFLESTKSEKKSSSTKTISVHKKPRSYTYADEYSSKKIPMPMIISTFSPTPFMF